MGEEEVGGGSSPKPQKQTRNIHQNAINLDSTTQKNLRLVVPSTIPYIHIFSWSVRSKHIIKTYEFNLYTYFESAWMDYKITPYK